MNRCLRVQITGRVQGVGFRYWMHAEAALLGINGWVRNRRDGSVEAVFAGAPEAVEAMLAHCRRGPSAARVSAVRILGEEEIAPVPFEIRPTV